MVWRWGRACTPRWPWWVRGITREAQGRGQPLEGAEGRHGTARTWLGEEDGQREHRRCQVHTFFQGLGPHLVSSPPSSLFCTPPPLAALQVAAQALKLPLSKVFISETSTDKVRAPLAPDALPHPSLLMPLLPAALPGSSPPALLPDALHLPSPHCPCPSCCLPLLHDALPACLDALRSLPHFEVPFSLPIPHGFSPLRSPTPPPRRPLPPRICTGQPSWMHADRCAGVGKGDRLLFCRGELALVWVLLQYVLQVGIVRHSVSFCSGYGFAS